ncbi:hypothetical protein H0I76_14300 [Limibaculum sp. M0105]|uniref:Glutamine amidotransferase domain-containing protein n=1 Tax=Thermohalobaculum xanthum TaxID=2753746 RepID=A0A8J7M9V1_9RHOB|nr:hypothetical protein [Thermohalobaculum xanthum]MBK0400368.1 hypothetical protein [Thermohalobaculum xanthum]
MQTTIAFDPLLPWPLIALATGLAVFCVGAAMWRGLTGWWLRALALGVLLAALCGPQLKREERDSLGNIGFLVVDRTESADLEDRRAQIDAAVEHLTAAAAELEAAGTPLDLRVIEVGPDTTGRNRGTRLLSALDDAASRVSADRIAGAVLVTDGQIHDAGRITGFPAPVHPLIAGAREGFDLRLELTNGPAFGIVGESVTFRMRALALGERPAGLGGAVTAQVSIDGGAPRPLRMMLSGETELEIPITHGGPTVVDVQLPVLTEELTDRNNRLIATVNGVRDRLRVLLVSGEPHPGGRTWRDLLKSDPTVDLIHFTILRPPAKQDGTPVSELSLIAFPTRELFLEKISNFDLIVFDRYRWRGVLASAYLANIARYVRDGGAVLVASGAAFSGPQSLARTPLGEILPGDPTMEVFERPFLPRVSALGERHPVTAGLEATAGIAEDGGPRWGRWLRHVDVAQTSGDAVMDGIDGRPLLILDRVGEGRVALLASDHAWLWSRGYEGGGPQADLLRRTAHWLMREPELEEEALFARTEGTRVLIERRTLAETPPETVGAVTPSGERLEITLRPAGPGRWQAVIEDAEEGLWRFSDGARRAVAAVGPPSPKEYEMPLASEELLAPLAETTGGDARWLADGTPDLRFVDEGRRTHGRSWVGMVDREAYRVTGIRLTPLLPVWLAALMTGLLFLGAWRREGR